MDFDEVLNRIKSNTPLRTQTDIADFLGIKSPSVSGAKSRNVFPLEWAFKIAQEYDVTTDWLMTGRSPKGVSTGENKLPGTRAEEYFDMVPMAVARLNAGSGSVVMSEGFRELYAFRKDWVSRIATGRKNICLMQVEGDSMQPTIYDGDTVMIDQGRTDIRTGRIYALGVEDIIMIKRLELLPDGRVKIRSDNTIYDPYIIGDSKSLRIIGQIIWFARELVPRSHQPLTPKEKE